MERVSTSVCALLVVFSALFLNVLVVLSFLNLLVKLPYKVLLHVEKFLGYLLLLLSQAINHLEDLVDALKLFTNAFVLVLKRFTLVLFQDVGLEGLLFLK